ncbi:MAG: hypothetical protein ACTSVO_02485 [Candidatus Heimdallarchaeaceae archaeon]
MVIARRPPLPVDDGPKVEGGTPPLKMTLRGVMFKLVFPHMKNRGKREYITKLILRISTYMAIGYGLSILFGVLYHLLQKLFTITTIIWSPDAILILPFTFAFEGTDSFELITNYLITAFIPFLLSGIIAGIIWREEAHDLIIPSVVFSLLFFILLYLSQIVLFTSSSISGFFASTYLLGFLVIFAFSLTIVSGLGGAIGVGLGKLLSSVSTTKKGSKITYSHLLLPNMPLSVKTIFDLDEPPKRSERQFSALSMVYLNRTVNLILRRVKTDTCIYYEDGRCAYLGYLTAAHKYQVCVSRYWPLCKIYAFLRQSKLVIDEVQKGDTSED